MDNDNLDKNTERIFFKKTKIKIKQFWANIYWIQGNTLCLKGEVQ